MRLGYCLLLTILLVPAVAGATVWLEFSADAGGNSCEIANPGLYQPVTVYVLVDTWGEEVTGIRFAAPVPASSGLTHVGDSSPFVIIGNSESDVTVAFGTCLPGKLVALQMNFYQTSAGDACAVYYPQPGAIFTDCNFNEYQLAVVDGVALNANGGCNPVPIHDISPAEGELVVPWPEVLLTWKNGYYVCNAPLASSGAPAEDSAQLYFGTSSNPPYVGFATSPHTVGPLDPGAVYYWKLVTEYPSATTPVMMFRTMVIDATQQSTWGAIKALYR